MLTNNGKAYLIPQRQTDGAANVTYKLDSGITQKKARSLIDGVGVILGTSSTPATADDYALGSQITGLTVVSEEAVEGTYDTRSVADKQISAYTATVRNDTENTITVAEVGVALKFSGVLNYALLSRDVINPVSIAPGKTYAFSVVWG